MSTAANASGGSAPAAIADRGKPWQKCVACAAMFSPREPIGPVG